MGCACGLCVGVMCVGCVCELCVCVYRVVCTVLASSSGSNVHVMLHVGPLKISLVTRLVLCLLTYSFLLFVN